MKKLDKLMKNVSLKNMHKIGDEEVKGDELLMVFFKDDSEDYHCNREVKVSGTLMQLDATLCYTRREVDHISRVKIIESYK